MAETDGRVALARLIDERGEDYAGLSRLLGRNAAYIQQFIKRGSPRRLAESDRRILARYFGVEEALLELPEARRAAAVDVRDESPHLDAAGDRGPKGVLDLLAIEAEDADVDRRARLPQRGDDGAQARFGLDDGLHGLRSYFGSFFRTSFHSTAPFPSGSSATSALAARSVLMALRS